MKKTLKKLTFSALMASAAFGITGCNVGRPETVYGPPSYFGVDEDEEPADPDDYDVTDNDNETVYGPPSWFGVDEEEEPVEIEVDEPEVYDPDDNMNEDVYGPPSYFGIDEEDGD